MEKEFQSTVRRVSLVSIIANIALFGFKLFAGIVAHSAAMVSDAIHSASDVFSTIIVLIGVRISMKEPDKEHPYGHERMECVAAIVLAVVLFITGLGIIVSAINAIIQGGGQADGETVVIPGMLALVAAFVSIIVKEGMYWFTRFFAKKIDSTALMADAWHHRSDSISSIGAILGIFASQHGFPLGDRVASIIIFVFITKAAIDIFRDALGKMVDRSCDEEVEQGIRECALRNEAVIAIDMLQTRMFGSRIYVDMEIGLDGNMTLLEAHDIAEAVHDEIEKDFPKIKHIMVHVNPELESTADITRKKD